MKPRPEEELDEARLQALFDQTAELPSGPTLTKLAARSREIPLLAQRRPWWHSLRITLPAGAAALAGVLAVLMLPPFGKSNDNLAPPAPTSVPVAQATLSVPSGEAPLASEPNPNNEVDTEELALGFDDADDGLASSISMDAIETESEAELDAWLDATEDLVDEGG